MKLYNCNRGVGQINSEESVVIEKSEIITSFWITKLPGWTDRALKIDEKEKIQRIIRIRIKEKGR